MGTEYSKFIFQNPTWKDFDGNTDAEIVFRILSRDASINSMIVAIAAGKPALSPCARAVEDLVQNVPSTTMPIKRHRSRQAVGVMVKSILAPYGYKPITYTSGGVKTEPLPSESKARYFKEAAVYEKKDAKLCRKPHMRISSGKTRIVKSLRMTMICKTFSVFFRKTSLSRS